MRGQQERGGWQESDFIQESGFYIFHETTCKTLSDVSRAVKDVSCYLIALQHKQQLIRGVWGRGIWCHPSYAGWILQGWAWYETIADLELMGCLHSRKVMLCKWAHVRPMLLLPPHTERGRERQKGRTNTYLLHVLTMSQPLLLSPCLGSHARMHFIPLSQPALT